MIASLIIGLALASAPMPPPPTDAPPAFLRSHCTDLRTTTHVAGVTQIGFGAPLMLSAMGSIASGVVFFGNDDMRSVSTALLVGGIAQIAVGTVLLHTGRDNLVESAQLVCDGVPSVAASDAR